MARTIWLLFLLIGYSNASSQWVLTDLNKLNVQCIAKTPSSWLAGTAKGIFRSTNSGVHWEPTGLKTGYITSIISQGPYIFAVDGSEGIFCSTNEGSSWELACPLFEMRYLAAMDSTLFASSESRGIFFSINHGKSWTPLECPDPEVQTLLVKGDTLFAAGQRVFFTTDTGKIWTQTEEGFNGSYISQLITRNTTIFALTNDQGIFVTTDHGHHWSSTADPGFKITAITTTSKCLFAGIAGGVLLSSDDGSSWAGGPALPNNKIITVVAICDTNILAVTFSNYPSEDTNVGIWRLPLSQMPSFNAAVRGTDKGFVCEEASPNPFDKATTIHYSIERPGPVYITIANLLGQTIQTTITTETEIGEHAATISADNLPNGIYLLSLKAEGAVKSQKIIVSR